MGDAGGAIAVTGIAVLSPIGASAATFWEALCAGRSGIAPLPEAGNEPPRIGARLPAGALDDARPGPQLRRADRLSLGVATCARRALDDAGLGLPLAAPERVGVVVGSALGNITDSLAYLARLFARGPSLASPLAFPNLVLNAAASYAAMLVGCTGPNLTVSHGELSGEQAITTACELLQSGRADVVVAGGADEAGSAVVLGYRRFRALSSQRGGPEWCSPYDADRNGVVLGEGTAMLVLEPATRARARGARVYAEIDGYVRFAVPAPAYDWPAMAPAAAQPLRGLLERAADGGRPGVDCVFGAGNSSRRLDACEIGVLVDALGDAAAGLPLTSIKGACGEFGAAGALSAAAACLAIHSSTIPPLCHFRRAPAGAPLHFPNTALRRDLRDVVMLSFARGGGAGALRLRRPSQ
ncbi:hypothetical protein L6Q96_00550 [Candidatus Binatia bacterium]|nr:hypothetical protein [Candidatus Binatia bacterium]